MNREQTARCHMLVAATYGTEVRRENVEAWHALLGDLDGDLAYEATVRLCRRDSAFPPRPGEVRAEVDRMSGASPPAVDAALGHFLAGNWDVHPLVEATARGVFWDRFTATDKATWDFRLRYTAALDSAAREPAVPLGPVPVGEIGPADVER